MFALMVVAARGGTPVLATADALDAAVATIVERTGAPADDLDPVDLRAIVPSGVPDAVACAGPLVGRAEMQAALDDAVAEYDQGHFPEAHARAQALSPAVACLTEPIDPDWAWSARFVAGVLAFADGDPAEAASSWTAARALDPQRGWDDGFAPGDALATFATALPTGSAPLRTIGGPFLVDGRPATETVPVGPHVLQAGDPVKTWLVDVRGPIVAVHPGADASTLDLPDLAAVLAQNLPPGGVYVVREGEVVRIELPVGAIRPIPPREPPTPPVRSAKLPAWTTVALGAGGLVVGGGLVDLGLAYHAAGKASASASAASKSGKDSEYWAANGQYEQASDQRWGAWGVMGAGVAVGAVGVVSALVVRF